MKKCGNCGRVWDDLANTCAGALQRKDGQIPAIKVAGEPFEPACDNPWKEDDLDQQIGRIAEMRKELHRLEKLLAGIRKKRECEHE